MGVQPNVQVIGLRELRRDIRRLEPDLVPEFRKELKATGESVVRDAKSKVPVGRSKYDKHPGAARDSLRVVSRGNTLYIAGGKAKVPYYGWLDFGGVLRAVGGRRNTQHRPVIKRGRYIYPAIDRNQRQIIRAAVAAVDKVKRQLDL